jgi:hypothetical protein
MKIPNFLTIDIHPDHDFYVDIGKGKMKYQELKSDYVLSEFIRYCLKHKNERFWQALRNFAKVDYVLLKKGEEDLKDTFYFEDINK